MGNLIRTHIRTALLMAGITQAEIARELGVTKQSVNQVIAGRKRSRRIQERLAVLLGRPFEELWGG